MQFVEKIESKTCQHRAGCSKLATKYIAEPGNYKPEDDALTERYVLRPYCDEHYRLMRAELQLVYTMVMGVSEIEFERQFKLIGIDIAELDE